MNNLSSEDINGEKNWKIVSETNQDLISKLPDELLLKILSRLFTEEALRTSVLSKRWIDLWKQAPNLGLNLPRIMDLPVEFLPRAYDISYRMQTQFMRRQWRQIQSCRVNHLSEQYMDGKVDVWIQQEDHRDIKTLVFIIEMSPKDLPNCKLYFHRTVQPDMIMSTSSTLLSLELSYYRIQSEFGNLNHQNLKTLKLISVFVESNILSQIISSSPCLEELIIRFCYKLGTCLKIKNNNLKFLELSAIDADEIEISGMGLDVLVLDSLHCSSKRFVVNAVPEIEINGDTWSGPYIYVACKISTESKERASNIPDNVLNTRAGYKLLMNNCRVLRNVGILAINVDFKNQRETEILSNFLKESINLRTLNLRIKNKTPMEDKDNEADSSLSAIRGPRFWENRESFTCLKDNLEYVTVKAFNGKEEEIGFVTYLITRATSLKKMTIFFQQSPAAERATAAATESLLLALPRASEKLAINMELVEACA